MANLDSVEFPVGIVGMGAVSPIGLDAAMNYSNYLANVVRFQLCERFRANTQGEPIKLSAVEWLELDLPFEQRLLTMATTAVSDVFSTFNVTHFCELTETTALPLIINFPYNRPDIKGDLLLHLWQNIAATLDIPLDQTHSGLIQCGHAGFISGLMHAMKAFQRGEIHTCLIGGVDSYINLQCLHFLEELSLLKTETNQSGFIPGEGAGFLLLASCTTIEQHPELQPQCWINAAASAQEPNLWYGTTPCAGEALTELFNELLNEQFQAELCYSDHNGEFWRSTEWEYAYLRTGQYHGHPLNLHHPAACYGDLGAASGALLATNAASELATGLENIKHCLLSTSANFLPLRSACTLQAMEAL